MPAPSPATSAECPNVAETVSDVAAFSVMGRAPKFMACASILGVRLRQAGIASARDLTLAVERRETRRGRLDDGRRVHLAVELDPEQLVEVLLGHLVPQSGAGRTGQRVVDDPLTGLVLRGLRAGDRMTRHLGRPEHATEARSVARPAEPWQQNCAAGVVRLVDARRRVRRVSSVRRDVVGRLAGARIDVEVGRGELGPR